MRFLGRLTLPTRTADPTSPDDGEVWHSAARLRARLAGVTRIILTIDASGIIADAVTWSNSVVFNSIALFNDRWGFYYNNFNTSSAFGNSARSFQRYVGAGGHTITMVSAVSAGTRQYIFENAGTGSFTVARGGTDTIKFDGATVTSVVVPVGRTLTLNNHANQWVAMLGGETPEVHFGPDPPADTSMLWVDTDDTSGQAVPVTIFAANGDLIVGSGNGAYQRLPVGADGKTLVPNSAAPAGVEYAGRAHLVGDIIMRADVRSGFFECDGSAVTPARSATLRAYLVAQGSPFGTNGTDPLLPNYRDRFPVGAGASYAVGGTGGAASITLTAAESGLPQHSHGYQQGTGGAPSNFADRPLRSSSGVGGGWFTDAAGPSNASQAHENRPPYLAVRFWMCTGD